jgi:hypothetical protein
MAKKKKGAFGVKDFVIVGGIAAVAYFIFSSFKKGITDTGGTDNTGNTTNSGGTLPPAGNTNTTGCNLLVNGFVNAGYVPRQDSALLLVGEPIFSNFTEAELKAPLKLGSKGIHVMGFQIYLNSQMPKSDLIPVDGVFGNQTVTLMRKNVQKYPNSQTYIANAYDIGALTLEIMDEIVSINLKSQLRKFNAGFLPNCPQAKEFYFGVVRNKDGAFYTLSDDVLNDY